MVFLRPRDLIPASPHTKALETLMSRGLDKTRRYPTGVE